MPEILTNSHVVTQCGNPLHPPIIFHEHITQPLIFTRYLYSKLEVKQSLLISLLDRKCDESLFWAYELYYSGYKQEVFEYLKWLYDWLYIEDNPQINTYIQSLYDDWIVNQTFDWHVGSIVATLCGRRYRLTEFIQTYFHVKTNTTINLRTNSKLIIRFSNKDIMSYQTIRANRFYLQNACKYSTRKEVNTLFKTEPINISNEYSNRWEYYAYKCPFWHDKFIKCNGKINHDSKSVDFIDDESYELFYSQWGIEPDEQSFAVKSKSIGKGDEPQLYIIDFCAKYGANIQMKKKVARKKNKKGVTPSKDAL